MALRVAKRFLHRQHTNLGKQWRAVGDRPVECLRFWSNLQPSIDTVTEGIIFAGLAKLHSYGKDRERLWSLGDRVTMVVFDEAHQAVATTLPRCCRSRCSAKTQDTVARIKCNTRANLQQIRRGCGSGRIGLRKER